MLYAKLIQILELVSKNQELLSVLCLTLVAIFDQNLLTIEV